MESVCRRFLWNMVENIKDIAIEMQNASDLLKLINTIKKDELGEHFHPYTKKQLLWFGNPNHVFHRYRNFEIPKKSGGMRQISAPYSQSYMHLLRYIAVILQSIYQPSAHTMGFVPGKSIVDNAKAHVGMNYVFNIDLKDFFPSIEAPRIIARLKVKPFCFPWKVAKAIAAICTMRVQEETKSEEKKYRYVLPQGSPASPVLTNLMCEKLDFLLSGLAKRFGLNYTRYADDITFSSMHNVYQEGSDFRKELERIISEQGFTINSKKTRLNMVGFRQEVTGLTVSHDKVNASRKYIKDLRGLLYIWEKYGYSEAQKRLEEHKDYHILRFTGRKGTSLSCVVEGKLAFLRMVKGANDSTYLTLQKRFEKLTKRTRKNQPMHTDFKYLETCTVAEFEQKKHTTIVFHNEVCKYATRHKEIGSTYTWADFTSGDQQIWVTVKNNLDITKPKDKLCISFCEPSNRSQRFWLIHEPFVSQYLKDKVNIDKLNEELDALITHG